MHGTAMKLTDALLGEHGVFYALFDQIESMAATTDAVSRIQGAMALLKALIMSHANIEEELLFPALEVHIGGQGPLEEMSRQHGQIEDALDGIMDARNIEEAADWVHRALTVARDHFNKEEVVLFAMARHLLDEATLNGLGEQWAVKRRVTTG